jgi:hypothetical protein
MYVFIFSKSQSARILCKLHLLTMCNVTCSHNTLILFNYYTITSITSNFKKIKKIKLLFHFSSTKRPKLTLGRDPRTYKP